jgi:hypothetical protein
MHATTQKTQFHFTRRGAQAPKRAYALQDQAAPCANLFRCAARAAAPESARLSATAREEVF